MLVAQQRAVGIAIRGNNGIEAILLSPAPGLLDIGIAHGFCVDGDEFIDTPQGDDLRTQQLQNFSQQVACDTGVLIEPEQMCIRDSRLRKAKPRRAS